MLDQSVFILQKDEQPIVHTYRGAHYRWQGWIDRMDNNNLIRSMSMKGCSPDNAACAGFFGRLKNEFFYGESWIDMSVGKFIELLDAYLEWYNNRRIKLSLGGVSIMKYRESMNFVA